MLHNLNKLEKTAMSGIAVVALTLAYFGWNALSRAEEFATFTLPPDGEGPTYKLASVNADEVVVEFGDAGGESQSVTISRLK